MQWAFNNHTRESDDDGHEDHGGHDDDHDDELNLSITERRRPDHSYFCRKSMRFGRQSETKGYGGMCEEDSAS